jgi:hypothetical protein
MCSGTPIASNAGVSPATGRSAADRARHFALVEELFHAALAVPESHRHCYLSLACAGDERLQREVESLLAFDKTARRLEEMVDRTRQDLGARIGNAAGA